MRYFTRREIAVQLDLEEGFVARLEQEAILVVDAPSGAAGEYSPRMLERARVAHNLVTELEVNLPGVAVILRMRDQLAELHHRVANLEGVRRR